ncbi:MAG TPA: hypothetical protein PKH69_02985 [Thiobacillaceae bacterium]|nr:hypothetical protein [Thiobacillaceae bacterium]HNU63052.1 hypothetical protein [Thiobacillaceae bacterium]
MLISQKLRPGDAVRFDTRHCALAPIAGLQMQDDAVRIGERYLLRCNRAEWETVERGYVFKDWCDRYYEANPVFLFEPATGPIGPQALAGVFDTLARDAARIVSACRLYKTGRLLEPVHTVRFIASGHHVHRVVGPYRTEYLAMPIDGLVWPLEADEVQDLTRLYDGIGSLEHGKGTESLRAVIDQFNLSHTPLIPTRFALHILLTAMEILFDGVSRRVVLGTTRYDRAREALRWAWEDGLDDESEAFFHDRLPALRNAIHHHAPCDGDDDLEAAVLRVQLAMMVGIRLLMGLWGHAAEEGLEAVRQAYGWRGLGVKDLLNACLDCRSRGDSTPLDEIARWYV